MRWVIGLFTLLLGLFSGTAYAAAPATPYALTGTVLTVNEPYAQTLTITAVDQTTGVVSQGTITVTSSQGLLRKNQFSIPVSSPQDQYKVEVSDPYLLPVVGTSGVGAGSFKYAFPMLQTVSSTVYTNLQAGVYSENIGSMVVALSPLTITPTHVINRVGSTVSFSVYTLNQAADLPSHLLVMATGGTISGGTPSAAAGQVSVLVGSAQKAGVGSYPQGPYWQAESATPTNFTTVQPEVISAQGTQFTVTSNTAGPVTLLVTDPGGNVVLGKKTIFFTNQTFQDVPSTFWGYHAIMGLASLGVLQGYHGQMYPQEPVTRATMAAILTRFLQLPVPTVSTGYNDVPTNAWYASDVMAVSSAGLMQGVGQNQFDPSGVVSREQLAVLLSRYLVSKGYHLPQSSSLAAFSDQGSIASWARSGVALAVQTGLMQGIGQGKFDPHGMTTRAQVAEVVRRLMHLTNSWSQF